MDEPTVSITSATVTIPDGTVVAYVEAVTVGGGTQTVTVDGVPEVRTHPTFHRFHVRLLSPDRMISDQLCEAETYEEAVEIGMQYAIKRVKHADKIKEIASDLRL